MANLDKKLQTAQNQYATTMGKLASELNARNNQLDNQQAQLMRQDDLLHYGAEFLEGLTAKKSSRSYRPYHTAENENNVRTRLAAAHRRATGKSNATRNAANGSKNARSATARNSPRHTKSPSRNAKSPSRNAKNAKHERASIKLAPSNTLDLIRELDEPSKEDKEELKHLYAFVISGIESISQRSWFRSKEAKKYLKYEDLIRCIHYLMKLIPDPSLLDKAVIYYFPSIEYHNFYDEFIESNQYTEYKKKISANIDKAVSEQKEYVAQPESEFLALVSAWSRYIINRLQKKDSKFELIKRWFAAHPKTTILALVIPAIIGLSASGLLSGPSEQPRPEWMNVHNTRPAGLYRPQYGPGYYTPERPRSWSRWDPTFTHW